MVSVTFKLRYDSKDLLVQISREFQVPVVPRIGETVFWGTEEAGDYFDAERVWHHPTRGTVEVEFHCQLWVLLEAWKSTEGWKVTEGNRKKFFHYLEHPEELKEE